MNRLLAVLLCLSPTTAFGATWAVLDFTPHVDDPALQVLGPGVADMVRTDLVRSGAVTLVERQHLDSVLAELDLQAGALVDPDTAVKVGRLMGADAMVVGSVHGNSGTVRLDARVVDVATGVASEARSVEGPASEIFALEHRLARQLVGEDVSDWGVPSASDMANSPSLLGAMSRIWAEGDAVPGPKVERRPATPAPPLDKKPCKAVRTTTDAIEGTQIRTAALPRARVSHTAAETVLTLSMPMLDGMKPNPAISDPAFYGGGSIQAQLLLTDGTLITLQSFGAPVAVATIGGAMEVTFRLDAAVVDALASAGPELLRWSLSKGTADYALDPRDAEKKWRPVFSCLATLP